MKPIGGKNYGSIAHLPGSRLGVGDHHCHAGQAEICTVKPRDKHDRIIVQEKLDGSNVGVVLVGGEIHALTRAGYLAHTSPHDQHHRFSRWVAENSERFRSVLKEGERLVGEWLLQAHGTRYELHHEPFVAFDLMVRMDRACHEQLIDRVQGRFVTPSTISVGPAMSIDAAMAALGEFGHHGALDAIEGAMWRVERNELTGKTGERKWIVDFLAKFVRHDKADGAYLESVSGKPPVYNTGSAVKRIA